MVACLHHMEVQKGERPRWFYLKSDMEALEAGQIGTKYSLASLTVVLYDREGGMMARVRATTILAVRRGAQVAMVGDGQVTVGDVVMKHRARKIRRLYHDSVVAGFAGSAADGITLLDRFESQLEQSSGKLRRAAVELAKEWRTDRFLRRLEAQLLAASSDEILLLSGDGDVIEPDDNVAAIGSGGVYAQAAATALLRHTDLPAADVALAAMRIAGEMCIYTNSDVVLETVPVPNS